MNILAFSNNESVSWTNLDYNYFLFLQPSFTPAPVTNAQPSKTTLVSLNPPPHQQRSMDFHSSTVCFTSISILFSLFLFLTNQKTYVPRDTRTQHTIHHLLYILTLRFTKLLFNKWNSWFQHSG